MTGDRELTGPQILAWMSATVFVLTLVLTLWLLTQEHGPDIATVLAVPIGILGLLVAVCLAMWQRADLEALRMSARSVSATVAVTVAVFVALGAVLWLYGRHADVAIDLGAPFVLREGERHETEVAAPAPTWRGDLVFTPQLASSNALGDCVVPAVLHITPLIDGQPQQSRTWHYDAEEIRIEIPEGSREVTLVIELREPDRQNCVVTTTLAHGRLDR
jgi:hypothetical protein